MVQHLFSVRGAPFLAAVFLAELQGPSDIPPSLFFTPRQTEDAKKRVDQKLFTKMPCPSSSSQQNSALKLQGILVRPDTREWIVWINDCRVDSSGDRKILGWTIISVDERRGSILIEDQYGNQKTLFVESRAEDR